MWVLDVRLEPVDDEAKLDGVDSIASGNDFVREARGTRSLTLPEIKRKLGRKLTNPTKPALPTLDRAEIARFQEPAEGGWTSYAIGGTLVFSVVRSSISTPGDLTPRQDGALTSGLPRSARHRPRRDRQSAAE